MLEIETSGLRVVSEDAPVLKPGPTDKRGPARQYPNVPDNIESELTAEIVETLDDDDWTEVTWNEGTNGTLTGSFYSTRVRVCINAYHRRSGDETAGYSCSVITNQGLMMPTESSQRGSVGAGCCLAGGVGHVGPPSGGQSSSSTGAPSRCSEPTSSKVRPDGDFTLTCR